MNTLILLGFVLLALSCACFYLASPHQRWRSRSWPVLPARLASGITLLLGGWTLAQSGMGTLTASFFVVTAFMFFGMLYPYIGALLTLSRKA